MSARPQHPYFAVPTPSVIGHRGCAGEVPENTLESFEAGLAQRAVILESDVHMTRDGVPVLIHDERVDRVSEGSGWVREMALAELKQLDAGYRFEGRRAGDFPFRGRGLRIPTLAEALEAFPTARFNLELKEKLPGLVDRAIEVIGEANRASTCLLAAADDDLMRSLRQRLAATGAGIACGASTGDVLAFVRSRIAGQAPPPGPMALQVPAKFGARPLVTPEFVEHARAHGLVVHVWTVNEIEEMQALLSIGVDGLVTDFPGRMAALLGV